MNNQKEQLRLDLVDNAFDYLLSAAQHAAKDSKRNWKYALLHLVAGTELLVKARLHLEHWSLLFSKVDEASHHAMNSGDFRSVDFQTACDRLQKIASVEIEEGTKDDLKQLRKLRNRVQHFQVSLSIEAVRSLSGKVMNFALQFYDDELKEELSVDAQVLEELYFHLRNFEQFVSERRQVIEPALSGQDAEECSICWQEALILGDGDPHCLFCGYTVTPEKLADEMSEGSVETCPGCENESLAFLVLTNEDVGWLCTTCGERYEEEDFETCLRCEKTISRNRGFCGQCMEYIDSQN